MRGSTPTVAAAVATIWSAAALAQDCSWSRVADKGPSPRFWHAAAYDSQRDVVVLFGGLTWPSPQWFDDTWEWDGESWALIPPPDPRPSARAFHRMVYDESRGVTVLFGGLDSTAAYLGDTWEWDGAAWTLASTMGPSNRESHGMTYDSDENVTLLFGGVGSEFYDDLWQWNGVEWAEIPQGSGDRPSARWGHTMAYDSGRAATVLYGGTENWPARLADTWEWDGENWTRQSDGAARYNHDMAYDADRAVTVVFGGGDTIFGGWGPMGDTSEWHGGVWSIATETGPAARHNATMVFDSQRRAMVLFGGYADGTLRNDTWEFRCESCYADCDGSSSLDFFDFLCFQNLFAAGDPAADCDGSTTLDFFDFLCFQNAFAAGCE